MATNKPPRKPMTTEEVRAQRQQVRHLMRHPGQHPNRKDHPSSWKASSLVHYALDLETPPLIACDAPGPDGIIWSTEAIEVTCPDCMKNEQFPISALKPLRPDQERALIRQAEGEAPIVTAYDLLMEAASLLSDEGENPEYDRAIVELTGNLIGAGPDDRILTQRILRALKNGQ